jgi:hypothetical protein
MKVYSELKNNGKFYDFLEILENEVENRWVHH